MLHPCLAPVSKYTPCNIICPFIILLFTYLVIIIITIIIIIILCTCIYIYDMDKMAERDGIPISCGFDCS